MPALLEEDAVPPVPGPLEEGDALPPAPAELDEADAIPPAPDPLEDDAVVPLASEPPDPDALVEAMPEPLEAPGIKVQPPPEVWWLDESFVPVRRKFELEGLGEVILTRTTREAATARRGLISL